MNLMQEIIFSTNIAVYNGWQKMPGERYMPRIFPSVHRLVLIDTNPLFDCLENAYLLN